MRLKPAALLFLFLTGVTTAFAAPPAREFEPAHPGSPEPVDYERFGAFSGIGTERYQYKITDKEDLATAGKKFNVWGFVAGASPREEVYTWLLAPDLANGERQFYVAEAYRKAGFLPEALKAYYTLIVHFPRTAPRIRTD